MECLDVSTSRGVILTKTLPFHSLSWTQSCSQLTRCKLTKILLAKDKTKLQDFLIKIIHNWYFIPRYQWGQLHKIDMGNK